ncbi:hypothetical protein tinsulaeT_00130 [Thalassotalea insulae]|uniref:Uncharacterized protein n=1 Tax=Thalassotalea insulae TaxID=2056778 RepID=A0ABQ6GKW9_9GAMM|nr:hypothetical protein [Thalassotalea insulae]GLX76673.1 hypothetical protein tinsulaeT_00130 [Thalassotalea insulae]
MEISTPAFNEKEFLLGLLAITKEKFGSELRFIMEHKFSSIDLDIIEYMPTLKKHSQKIEIKKYLSQWFAEALARNLVIRPTKDHHFVFSKQGYEAALINKSPVKYFAKNHWAWFTGIVIGVLNLAAAIIIKVIQCSG